MDLADQRNEGEGDRPKPQLRPVRWGANEDRRAGADRGEQRVQAKRLVAPFGEEHLDCKSPADRARTEERPPPSLRPRGQTAATGGGNPAERVTDPKSGDKQPCNRACCRRCKAGKEGGSLPEATTAQKRRCHTAKGEGNAKGVGEPADPEVPSDGEGEGDLRNRLRPLPDSPDREGDDRRRAKRCSRSQRPKPKDGSKGHEKQAVAGEKVAVIPKAVEEGEAEPALDPGPVELGG